MGGEILIFLTIAVILVWVVYLFVTSGMFHDIQVMIENSEKQMKKHFMQSEVKLAQPPIVSVEMPGEKDYVPYQMESVVFPIGSVQRKNGLFLDSETVEARHAVIYQRVKDGKVWYELVNYAKKNPVKIYNWRKTVYEYLGKKEVVELELGSCELFYIGACKVKVEIPPMPDPEGKTELMVKKENKETVNNTTEKKSEKGERKTQKTNEEPEKAEEKPDEEDTSENTTAKTGFIF